MVTSFVAPLSVLSVPLSEDCQYHVLFDAGEPAAVNRNVHALSVPLPIVPGCVAEHADERVMEKAEILALPPPFQPYIFVSPSSLSFATMVYVILLPVDKEIPLSLRS